MTPKQEPVFSGERLKKETLPSLTWKLNGEKGEVREALDGAEAMRQAVEKILGTERYRFPIYDWNYGTELSALYGKSPSFVVPELKRRIEEALLADDRIRAVTDFSFERDKNSITAGFTVHTVFGVLREERKVELA